MRLIPAYCPATPWLTVALSAAQMGLVCLTLQLDQKDALMSLGDGGIVLLPLALILLVLSLSAFQAKRWFQGLCTVLFGLPSLLVGSVSLHLLFCCGTLA